MFRNEVFFYFYYAGHGCQDHKQHIVLNESDISKVFWPAEYKIKYYLRYAGSNSKALVVFDCCREDLVPLKARLTNSAKPLLENQPIVGEETKFAVKTIQS